MNIYWTIILIVCGAAFVYIFFIHEQSNINKARKQAKIDYENNTIDIKKYNGEDIVSIWYSIEINSMIKHEIYKNSDEYREHNEILQKHVR